MADQQRRADQQHDTEPGDVEAEGVVRDGYVKRASLQESP
jgi:hypothetical protein